MVQWAWESAQKAGISRVAVATDDERIMAAVAAFGGDAVFTDPSLPSGTDRVAAAMDALGGGFEIVLNIQGDEPAMHHETIAAVARLMEEKPELPIGTAACPFESPDEIFSPNNVKVVLDEAGRALYFSRSPIPFLRSSTNFGMDFRPWMAKDQLQLFRRHLGIYAYRPDVLRKLTALPPHPLEQAEMLEQLRALAAGIAIGVAHTPHCSIGVDTPGDVALAEEMLKIRCQELGVRVNNVAAAPR
jgi:3-deoxy-manno-octulosonate cytidylyltransferase (CMP-KDO synthetase)